MCQALSSGLSEHASLYLGIVFLKLEEISHTKPCLKSKRREINQILTAKKSCINVKLSVWLF